MRTCNVDGCERRHFGKGFCQMHHSRWRKTGNAGAAEYIAQPQTPICIVAGCDKPSRARSWCVGHWKRWRLYGDPGAAFQTREEKFWSCVQKTEHCWLWTGRINAWGYGAFQRSVAHHFLIGKPTRGKVWDHTCHNACPADASCIHRRCVKPEHLDLVTPAENVRRGREQRRVRLRSKPPLPV